MDTYIVSTCFSVGVACCNEMPDIPMPIPCLLFILSIVVPSRHYEYLFTIVPTQPVHLYLSPHLCSPQKTPLVYPSLSKCLSFKRQHRTNTSGLCNFLTFGT